MKSNFICGLVVGIGISVFVSCTQEFVLPKKEKKTSVSSQQCAEMIGDYIHIFPDVMQECSTLISLCAQAHKSALNHLNTYIEGKEGLHQLTKSQRAHCYKKVTDMHTELQDVSYKLSLMQHTLEGHVSTLASFHAACVQAL